MQAFASPCVGVLSGVAIFTVTGRLRRNRKVRQLLDRTRSTLYTTVAGARLSTPPDLPEESEY